MQISGFDWDDGNRDKCQKHGLSIAEIEAMFMAGSLTQFPDPYAAEARLRGIGRTAAGRHVFIVWTVREISGAAFIRPISARYMHAKEIDHYEQSNP